MESVFSFNCNKTLAHCLTLVPSSSMSKDVNFVIQLNFDQLLALRFEISCTYLLFPFLPVYLSVSWPLQFHFIFPLIVVIQLIYIHSRYTKLWCGTSIFGLSGILPLMCSGRIFLIIWSKSFSNANSLPFFDHEWWRAVHPKPIEQMQMLIYC